MLVKPVLSGLMWFKGQRGAELDLLVAPSVVGIPFMERNGVLVTSRFPEPQVPSHLSPVCRVASRNTSSHRTGSIQSMASQTIMHVSAMLAFGRSRVQVSALRPAILGVFL